MEGKGGVDKRDQVGTERIRLREFVPGDLDALAAIFADPVMMEYYPHPFSREESADWIARWRSLYAARGFGLWAMELRETGELAGDCGLIPQIVEGAPEVEIGWHVRRDLWNRGLATEAAGAVRDYAFGRLGLVRLISLIRPENGASRRVAEKIGMTVEKEVAHGSTGWRHLVYASHAS